MAKKSRSNLEQINKIKDSLAEFILIAKVVRGDEPDPLPLEKYTWTGRALDALRHLERTLNPMRREFDHPRRRELRNYGWPYDSPHVSGIVGALQPLRELVDDVLIAWKFEQISTLDGFLFGPGEAQLSGPYSKNTAVINVGEDWRPEIDFGVIHAMESVYIHLAKFLNGLAFLASESGTATSEPDPNDNQRQSFRLVPDDDAQLFRWRGQRLTINSHADFKALSALNQNAGAIVSYTKLLRAIDPSKVRETVKLTQAPQEVKDAVGHIRVALQKAGCTLTLDNIKQQGYRLLSPDL